MITKIFIIVGFLFLNSCKAQIVDDPLTIAEYPNFYNQTVTRLNNIIPNKTNYYGQPLYVFLHTLQQKNIIVKEYDAGPYDNKYLQLSFVWSSDIRTWRYANNYVEPYIAIYFQQPFNYQEAIAILNNGYFSHWNQQAENFYKNLIIEKIEFWDVNGLTDQTSPPK